MRHFSYPSTGCAGKWGCVFPRGSCAPVIGTGFVNLSTGYCHWVKVTLESRLHRARQQSLFGPRFRGPTYFTLLACPGSPPGPCHPITRVRGAGPTCRCHHFPSAPEWGLSSRATVRIALDSAACVSPSQPVGPAVSGPIACHPPPSVSRGAGLRTGHRAGRPSGRGPSVRPCLKGNRVTTPVRTSGPPRGRLRQWAPGWVAWGV